MIQYVYGQIDPIFFALIDINGDGVLGHALLAADVKLIVWNDEDDTMVTSINIGTECIEVGNGFYKWTPSISSRTQHSALMVYINDSVGSAFIENRLIVYTGGDPAKLNSRLRG